MSVRSTPRLAISQRIRKSAYFDRTVDAGVQAFTVYNHMLLPVYYESIEADYESLTSNVTIWDVAVQRQVDIKGPDAYHLVRLMTPRNLKKFKIGQCKYVPIVDDRGRLLNDPVALRLAEDHFWLSLADSDILLYAKGLAIGMGLDVEIHEPDVSPLAIQGPNADLVMRKVFGEEITKLRFFRFKQIEHGGMKLLIARSGWSKQGGYEIYLYDSMLYGTRLWDMLFEAGREFGIKPAAPNQMERVESGLLSYGNDMTMEHSPLEIGLEMYCDLEQEFDFIGKAALQKEAAEGPKRKLVGLVLEGERLPGNTVHWVAFDSNWSQIGIVTSTVYSTHANKNIAMAILDSNYVEPGSGVSVMTEWGEMRSAMVTALPFELEKVKGIG